MDLLTAASGLMLASMARSPSWVPPVAPLSVERPFSAPGEPWGAGHRGVDLAAGLGQSVASAGPGRVVLARWIAGRWVIAVEHPAGLAPLPAGTWRTTYEGVKPIVAEGTSVRPGGVLGILVGGGHCACLHWGLKSGSRYADPLQLLLPETILKPVSLGPRVGLLEGRPQTLDGDMGVHLRRREARVPEQLLDRTKVGTALEDMRRSRVPQPVRPEVGHPIDVCEDAMDDASHRARVDALPALPQEYGGTASVMGYLGPAALAPLLEGLRRRDAEGHDSLPASLAVNAKRAPPLVDIVDVEATQFRDADSRGVEELHHGAIA